jgi:acetyl esterase/lipase
MALQSVFLLQSAYTLRVLFLGRTTAAGLAFISADYRLLPPSTGHDVLKDVVDLFAFLARTPMLGNVLLDGTRLAVAGASAGGMCAFLAAVHANPRPRAVLSLYGLGGDVFVSAQGGEASEIRTYD